MFMSMSQVEACEGNGEGDEDDEDDGEEFCVPPQTLNRLSCNYKKENQTNMVVCDLGNPMKGGTKVSEGTTSHDASGYTDHVP